ncbi:MAG: tRNA lysidine(34) synthetase TilS [Bdellovibrionales bacterium]
MVHSLNQKRWLNLELRLYKTLKDRGLQGSRILIGVSGGADSVALAWALKAVSSALRLKLALAHIHHGPTSSQKQKSFRQSSRKFCEDLAHKLELPFLISEHRGPLLKGEAALRVVRYEHLESLRRQQNWDYIATAHHAEDLLETRLIRLIRGVGAGGLQSLSLVSAKKLRPFLKVQKTELLGYLQELQVSYMDDPSNEIMEPLRNWIRKEWLPLLEQKRPGALASLSRSLELVTRRAKKDLKPLEVLVTSEGLDRSQLLSLASSEQRQVLALFLRQKGVQSYTSTQIDEVLKRLRAPRRDFHFHVVKCHWQITSKYIQILPS